MSGSTVGETPSDIIGRYLSRLSVAAAGLDPALVNDVLADAEQHLWNAVADGIAPQQAIADFGEPADVVAAYVRADSGRRTGALPPSLRSGAPAGAGVAAAAAGTGNRTAGGSAAGVWAWVSRVALIWVDRYAWGSLALFILGYALALAYFVIVTTWGTLALGMILLIIGLPLLVGLLGFCRVVALGHGRLIELTTGVRMPRRTAPVGGTGLASFWGRVMLWLRDGRSWLSVAFLLGNFPVAVLLFTVFLGLLAMSLSLVVAPVGVGVFPGHYHIDLGIWDQSSMPFVVSLVLSVVGLAMLTGTLWLAKGCGWLYAQVVKAIQVTRPVAGGPVQPSSPGPAGGGEWSAAGRAPAV